MNLFQIPTESTVYSALRASLRSLSGWFWESLGDYRGVTLIGMPHGRGSHDVEGKGGGLLFE